VVRQKRRSRSSLPRRSLRPGSRRWPVCRRSVDATSLRTGNPGLRHQGGVARQNRRSRPSLPRRSLRPGSRRWPVCRRSVDATSLRTGNLALRRQVTPKGAYGWAKGPVCPALTSSTSTPTRKKNAARCCRHSLRRECSMSGRFDDAIRRRQIAGRRQGEQLATREWPVPALHSRLLSGEPRPRWSVETAACQATTPAGSRTDQGPVWRRAARWNHRGARHHRDLLKQTFPR
jgi:hypothetical protein